MPAGAPTPPGRRPAPKLLRPELRSRCRLPGSGAGRLDPPVFAVPGAVGAMLRVLAVKLHAARQPRPLRPFLCSTSLASSAALRAPPSFASGASDLPRARSAPSHATGRVPRPPRVPESLAHCCTFQSLLLSAAPVRRRQVPLPARRHRPSRSSASLASCQDQRRPLLPAAARPCPDDQQLELPPRTSCDLPRQGLDKSLDAPPDVSMPLFDPCTTTR